MEAQEALRELEGVFKRLRKAEHKGVEVFVERGASKVSLETARSTAMALAKGTVQERDASVLKATTAERERFEEAEAKSEAFKWYMRALQAEADSLRSIVSYDKRSGETDGTRP